MFIDTRTSERLSGRSEGESARVRVLLVLMLMALTALGIMLWRVQVVHASRYMNDLEKQSMRRVRLPGMRGAIYDRNGLSLADNRPSYCVAIYVEELRQTGRWGRTIDEVERVVDSLAPVLGLPRTVSRDDIRKHILRRLPLPFIAWRDLDAKALARWSERRVSFAGVDLYIEPVRHYPEGTLGSHMLGHVGRLDIQPDPAQPFNYYLPEMEGKNGVEKTQNGALTGSTGGMLLRVDASGFKHDVLKVVESGRGSDVFLTIDARIQRLAESVIASTNRAAAVVMDPRNGDVLAMASAPGFDPNVFSPAIRAEDWEQLRTNQDRPLVNRAISGAYPPGSTFKPLVAIAALENRCVPASQEYNCPGYFERWGVRFGCWRKSGHGSIAMRKGIEQSCNTYFCHVGLDTGYERIYHMADAIGFGQQTGIELDSENPGLLPSDEWKQRTQKDSWRPGDTCNISIGQGALLVTPLQMAMFTCALANGGDLYPPRLVLRGRQPPEPAVRLGWSQETMQVVRGGMRDVIHAEFGTGKRALVEGIVLAGKTGTAEYGSKAAGKKHAWMIAFGPYDNPRYAVAIVLENALSGGRDAGPRVRELVEGILAVEAEDAERLRGGRA